MIEIHEKFDVTQDDKNRDLIKTIVNSEEYLDYIKMKKQFLVKMILFFICFYFALPLGIILFPKIMSIVVYHHFTIAWAFAFLQFVMIWVLGGLYYLKAKQFDRLSENLASWGK